MWKKIKLQNRRILFILAGFLFAFGLANTICKPDFPIKQIPNSRLIRNGRGWQHIGEDERTILFLEDKVRFSYKLENLSDAHSWNYREFYISNLQGRESLEAVVVFYDAAGNELATSRENWGNGYNLVQNPVTNFKKIRVSFYNYKAVSFTMEGMRILETLPYMPKKKIFLSTLFFFFLYLLFMYLLKEKVPYETIMREAVSCMEDLFAAIQFPKWKRQSSLVRKFLWVLLFLFSEWIVYRTQVGSQRVIRYLEAAMLIIFFLLAVAYAAYPARKEQWKETKRMQYTWLLGCIWLLISDFFVEKRCQYMGVVLLFGGGFLLQMLLKRDCMEVVLKDIILAFLITMCVTIAWKLFMINRGVWQLTEIEGLKESCIVIKDCLREMNLFGHSKSLFARGRKCLPYNGLLYVGYTYGSMAILPCVILWFEIFAQSVRCFVTKRRKRLGWLAGILLMFLYSMLGNVL